MRRGPRRVHANLRPLSVFGHPAGTGDVDRTGLRPRRERLRLQAEKFCQRDQLSSPSGTAQLLTSNKQLRVDTFSLICASVSQLTSNRQFNHFCFSINLFFIYLFIVCFVSSVHARNKTNDWLNY